MIFVMFTQGVMMSHSEKVHYNPILCFTVPITGDPKQMVTVSNDINYVTCHICAYYYMNPEARLLELAFRGSK